MLSEGNREGNTMKGFTFKVGSIRLSAPLLYEHAVRQISKFLRISSAVV